MWILISSNAHITKSSQVESTNKSTEAKIKLSFQKKYSIRTATITVTIKIKPKKYQEYAKALHKFSTYLLPQ